MVGRRDSRADHGQRPDSQKAAGRDGPALYPMSFSIMIGPLLVAVVCNELLKPVDPRHELSATPRRKAEARVR